MVDVEITFRDPSMIGKELNNGKLFIEPFTERSTRRQSMVNKKDGQSTVIVGHALFLRLRAETAHDRTFTLYLLLHSCAGPVPARKKLGHGGQFPVCPHVVIIFLGPQCSCGPKADLHTVKRPEVGVFGEAPAAEKSKRPASASKVPEDVESWNDSIRKGLQLCPR